MHGVLVMPAPRIAVARTDPEWQDWLAARAGGISASDIAAVLNINPWDSPFSLYWRKKLNTEIDPSPQMEWGGRLEDPIGAKFADLHPAFDVRPGGLYRHPDHAWMLATPDRLLHDRHPCLDCPECGGAVDDEPAAVLELKTASSLDEWGDEDTDQVPLHYRAQVIYQLDVLGLPRAHVALLSRGSTYREYTVQYDVEDAAIMRKAAAEFMERLANDDAPDIDGSAATTTTLKALHPSVVDEAVTVPTDLADQYRVRKELLDDAQAAYDEAANRIRALIGDNRIAVADGRKVAQRSVYDRAGFDTKRFKADHPDLFAEYETTTTVDALKPCKETP